METTTKKRLDYRFIIIGVLILAGVILYFYKNYEIKQAKENLTVQADSLIIKQNKRMLMLTAKPLVWAIRSEMLRNNLDEINVFTTDLVKEKNIQDISLLNTDGKIINSTNKKLEGTIASADYKSYLTVDSVTVLNTSDSVARVIAPVMGYQSKLGVIILNYKIERFNPE